MTVGLLAEWRTLAPLSEAAGTLWGRPGELVLGVAGLLAFLTTGNAGIMAASRTIMAMSQDELLPRRLGSVSKKWGTPIYAIVMTAGFMVAVILLLDLMLFVKAASAMMILLFMFTMLCVVLMRESRIPTYGPSWRSPLYPWVQIAGLLAYAFLLVELGTVPLAIAGVILGGALAWYALYAKVHVLRESALIRLAGRLAAADFEDHDLEAELSRVARERDAVLEDRFDRLIQDCTVLDLTGEVSRDELLHILADNLAPAVHHPPAELYALLQKREMLSSTVIRPGLAIPHLILEGLSPFQAVLVRSRAGVVFSEGEQPVHAVFVLAASPAERNFYLRALVAIAEIAQEADFDQKWEAAGSPEALREVVLAAERRREHSVHHPPAEGT
ncbi:MAG: amino acid permease [Planctomycetota bacterium]